MKRKEFLSVKTNIRPNASYFTSMSFISVEWHHTSRRAQAVKVDKYNKSNTRITKTLAFN